MVSMNLTNKTILHIESFPDTPLIDTSSEIALDLKDNNNVNFFWCGYDLPWKDWELGIFKKIIGFNFEKKMVCVPENTLYVVFTNGFHKRSQFNGNSERSLVFLQYVERFNKLDYLF